MQDVFQNSFDALIGDMGDDLSLEDKEILIKRRLRLRRLLRAAFCWFL
jgi:hypothetical protein